MTPDTLRILLCDPHLKGGGQVRYVASLAKELTRLGHAVTIACKPGSVLAGAAADAGCSLLDTFHFRGGLRPKDWWQDVARMRGFIQRERPDVLHASGSQDHWVIALANRTLGRPVCVVRTRHNTYPVHGALPNRILNRSWTDFQIVVCETVRARLAQQASFDAARMCTIHNGVDPSAFAPDPEARRRARSEFGYGNEHVVLGIAARLNVAKGHTFLFQAVSPLVSEMHHLRILVLGQGPLEAALREEVLALRLDSVVTFAGFRQNMGECLQAFDVGVQPSIACEASSFSIMEQMAAAKPIVTSDHGGSKEIVRDGCDGYVVPAGTVEPLRDALRRLVSDAGLRTAMGQNARERVKAEFTLDILARRTIDAYRNAIEIHRDRGAPSRTD